MKGSRALTLLASTSEAFFREPRAWRKGEFSSSYTFLSSPERKSACSEFQSGYLQCHAIIR